MLTFVFLCYCLYIDDTVSTPLITSLVIVPLTIMLLIIGIVAIVMIVIKRKHLTNNSYK